MRYFFIFVLHTPSFNTWTKFLSHKISLTSLSPQANFLPFPPTVWTALFTILIQQQHKVFKRARLIVLVGISVYWKNRHTPEQVLFGLLRSQYVEDGTDRLSRNVAEKLPLLDVRGSVHHNTIHEEKSNKMQQCIKILLFHIYMKLNMFRATHRPSSGA